ATSFEMWKPWENPTVSTFFVSFEMYLWFRGPIRWPHNHLPKEGGSWGQPHAFARSAYGEGVTFFICFALGHLCKTNRSRNFQHKKGFQLKALLTLNRDGYSIYTFELPRQYTQRSWNAIKDRLYRELEQREPGEQACIYAVSKKRNRYQCTRYVRHGV